MKLEDQVCSLELAKRLKELGVKQESYFCWYGNILASEDRVKLDLKERGLNCYGSCEIYSAFTVAELGEMLLTHAENKPFTITKLDNGQYLFDSNYFHIGFFAKTEADARAEMIIHLMNEGSYVCKKRIIDET